MEKAAPHFVPRERDVVLMVIIFLDVRKDGKQGTLPIRLGSHEKGNKMERSGSQKALKVISIIGIIGGILTLISAGIMLFGGGLLAGVTDEVIVDGMTNAEVGGMVGFAGAISLIAGLVYLIQGILGVRASNDFTKINPVWILAIIGIVFAVLSFISLFVNGEPVQMSEIVGGVASVAFAGLYFWIANNIKKQNVEA